jgi:hypothetical protein
VETGILDPGFGSVSTCAEVMIGERAGLSGGVCYDHDDVTFALRCRAGFNHSSSIYYLCSLSKDRVGSNFFLCRRNPITEVNNDPILILFLESSLPYRSGLTSHACDTK